MEGYGESSWRTMGRRNWDMNSRVSPAEGLQHTLAWGYLPVPGDSVFPFQKKWEVLYQNSRLNRVYTTGNILKTPAQRTDPPPTSLHPPDPESRPEHPLCAWGTGKQISHTWWEERTEHQANTGRAKQTAPHNSRKTVLPFAITVSPPDSSTCEGD